MTDKKLCTICENVFHKDLFIRGKCICKECYSKKNKENYTKRKEQLQQQKAAIDQLKKDITDSSDKNYSELLEENLKLKNELNNLKSNTVKKEELENMIKKYKKLKEICELTRKALELSDEDDIV
jgi:transcriptional/translational regulatory protein YebC/TACO1